jgi:hypothetical protein
MLNTTAADKHVLDIHPDSQGADKEHLHNVAILSLAANSVDTPHQEHSILAERIPDR